MTLSSFLHSLSCKGALQIVKMLPRFKQGHPKSKTDKYYTNLPQLRQLGVRNQIVGDSDSKPSKWNRFLCNNSDGEFWLKKLIKSPFNYNIKRILAIDRLLLQSLNHWLVLITCISQVMNISNAFRFDQGTCEIGRISSLYGYLDENPPLEVGPNSGFIVNKCLGNCECIRIYKYKIEGFIGPWWSSGLTR